MNLKLYGYYRSSTTYRVRLALNYKKIPYQTVPIDLSKDRHQETRFRAINPQRLVPALVIDDEIYTQSPAILEWIEETFPQPFLLPTDTQLRAKIRAFSAVIGCDIHPIQNLRVLKKLKSKNFSARKWAAHWIKLGLDALESQVAQINRKSGFLYCDRLTLAEIYLLPQMFNALRFGVDISSYPVLGAACAAANELKVIHQAHPKFQDDCPEKDSQ